MMLRLKGLTAHLRGIAAGTAVVIASGLAGSVTEHHACATEPTAVGPLDSVPVPLPPDLDKFVANRNAAILLGKSLFWDMQAGSDGKTACATCHFHAGADHRTKNTIAPNGGGFRGANYRLKASDFPFHRLLDPTKPKGDDNPVIYDTSEIAGSQGVIERNFTGIVDGSPVDAGVTVPDTVFHIDGVNARQVTGRNTPSAINAVFNDRNFWDGRANRFFNGVNPFGDMDPDAQIWVSAKNKELARERILLDNASLASQAVGPPLSEVEMSWLGRTFPDLGRKMLPLRPLAQQFVHPEDSVLGPSANRKGLGLKSQIDYADLVRKSFRNRLWDSTELTPDGYTLMEQNFALFWGLSIMMYESTLVSDDSPFDRFMKGDNEALSLSAQQGFDIFMNQGRCSACHGGPEFTGAAISQLRGVLAEPGEAMIEFMPMQNGASAFYDGGFYNIGVRPTGEDLGVGGGHPVLGPWSLTRRAQQGRNPNLGNNGVFVSQGARVAVDGAFKTPGLRNVELTGPYMHNGGMRTLEEVVQFYARRADFFEENIDDLDPDVAGIGHVRGNQQKVQSLVDFLKSLTDERVRYRRAPFDHPELLVPNGHTGVTAGLAVDDVVVIQAVGRNGGTPLKTFEESVP